MRLIVLVSPLCELSLRAAREARGLSKRMEVLFEEVSVTERRGERLALEKGVSLLPAYLVDGEVVHKGLLRKEELEAVLKGGEVEG